MQDKEGGSVQEKLQLLKIKLYSSSLFVTEWLEKEASGWEGD